MWRVGGRAEYRRCCSIKVNTRYFRRHSPSPITARHAARASRTSRAPRALFCCRRCEVCQLRYESERRQSESSLLRYIYLYKISNNSDMSCAHCQQPLTLEVDYSDDEDENVSMGAASSSAPAQPKTIPDDVALSCGCHFHWCA